jgi:hypothetical protein
MQVSTPTTRLIAWMHSAPQITPGRSGLPAEPRTNSGCALAIIDTLGRSPAAPLLAVLGSMAPGMTASGSPKRPPRSASG